MILRGDLFFLIFALDVNCGYSMRPGSKDGGGVRVLRLTNSLGHTETGPRFKVSSERLRVLRSTHNLCFDQ